VKDLVTDRDRWNAPNARYGSRSLFGPLVITEKECFVSDKWTAKCAAILILAKRRLGQAGSVSEEVVRIEF
jgi:hypothetical protein